MNYLKKCTGDGYCLLPYSCKYVNKNINNDNNQYYHYVNKCCQLIECRNLDYCNNKMPLWLLKEYNGLCDTCFIQMGDHTLINKIEECPICLEDSTMVKLKCNHLICNDCWFNITLTASLDQSKDFTPECPICRNKN